MISKILSLVLIWILCSADGCNNDVSMADLRVEKQISAEKDSIIKMFDVEMLSDQILRAYEETAKQKLIDFADYLKIASDSSLDKAFRVQASTMVEGLFISEKTDISGWSNSFSESGIKTVSALLEACLSEGTSFWIKPFQLSVQNSFKMKNDSVFKGNLAFYTQKISSNEQPIPITSNEMLLVDIYIIKKTKSFGSQTLLLWEAGLGDITSANNR